MLVVARGKMICGAKGRHMRNNAILSGLLKEANKKLLQISRGISFHIEDVA